MISSIGIQRGSKGFKEIQWGSKEFKKDSKGIQRNSKGFKGFPCVFGEISSYGHHIHNLILRNSRVSGVFLVRSRVTGIIIT